MKRNKKNTRQKFEQIRKAAEQGNADAQLDLGLMYANGDGVAKDHVAAYMWSSLAATNGNENGTNLRDTLKKDLTSAQIKKGQRVACEWMAKYGQQKAQNSPMQP